MQSAGQLLQSERLKRNKSLADIASETRISSRYLDAIERDDTSQLPGDFFYKAFLRQYASTLELDRATTDRIVASAVPTEEVDPVPAFNEAYANASTGASSRWTPPTSVAIALLVMVLAGGSGLYAWWQKAQTVKEAEAERFSQQTAQAGGESKSQSVTKSRSSEARPAEAMPTETRPEELKPAEAPVEKLAESPATGLETPRPQTPLSSPYTSTIPAEAAPVPVGSMVVELVATEPTWVQLSSGGKTVYIGTLDPAERRQFSVDENAKLLTGNAGTLDLKLNGKDVGTIGPRGQIRTVVFANSSFQIASPKTAHPPAFEGTPSTPTVAKRPTTVDR